MSNENQSAPVSALNSLYNQEVKTIVSFTGMYLIGSIEEYKIGDNEGTSAFIQLAVPQRDDSKALKIKKIKVPEECRGYIDLLNNSKFAQIVELQCEIREYGTKTDTYLTVDQPKYKLSKAA